LLSPCAVLLQHKGKNKGKGEKINGKQEKEKSSKTNIKKKSHFYPPPASLRKHVSKVKSEKTRKSHGREKGTPMTKTRGKPILAQRALAD